MTENKISDSTSVLRTEGVILVVLTATTYAAFLMREMGYADYFSIPHEIIVASHIGLLSAAQALFWGAMAYIGKVNLVWLLAPRAEGFLYSFFRYFIAVILFIGFALYPYLMTDLSWWVFFISIAFFSFGWLIWPLITQRKVKGYENKLSEQLKLELNFDSIYDTLLGKLERSARLTVIFIVVIMIFAYGDGRKSAFEQESFNMLTDEPNVALLRVYGEVMVAATLDVKARKLKGSVKIQKMAEGKWIEIQSIKIGRISK